MTWRTCLELLWQTNTAVAAKKRLRNTKNRPTPAMASNSTVFEQEKAAEGCHTDSKVKLAKADFLTGQLFADNLGSSRDHVRT